MVEVRDTNSGAILFKKTKSEKKVEELEVKVKSLEESLKSLLREQVLTKDTVSSESSSVSI